MKRLRLPSVYTILFSLIVIVAILTWFIPAGKYDMVENDVLGRMVPVAGSYHSVEANSQGISEILLAPINEFYNHSDYTATAVDVALFVLIIGGFLAVVTRTGAIDNAIGRTTERLKGREIWMIPILMGIFATGGTVYGMAEETIAFYPLIIPVMIAAGYDALTGVAVVMIGAGIGCLGSTINPFATVIASNAAGISFIQGMLLRVVILVAGWLICVFYVMRYARLVKRQPERSLVRDLKEENEAHFLHGHNTQGDVVFTRTQKLVLAVFAATFAVMIWGVTLAGWWMAEISALFLGATIVIGLVARMGEEELTTSFIDGARDLLGVALVIALARGIVMIMDAGNITHTLIYWAESMVQDLSPVAFINAVYWIEAALSLLVPSSSGLAVMTMPIMAPLGDFVGVGRDLVVTAFQSASGLPNLINPTSAIVMGGLAMGRVSYGRWFKFTAPLLAMLIIMIMVLLSLGVLLS
ncbi:MULTISPECIES: YfcC family protein [unclassified Halomonas]|uniref:YfcC family protein n=1 Tax=unclassified Halomonas TaxID=2609666 RepID=UPI002884E205|nr:MULTISPECIES: YfcC family protein [unclassified Halomonas]MDT0511158.1 YfcC family protein [Halomonas sp. LES1]MDT0590553.1 YfcC family protein [Halomonas sp. PAR8]